MRPKESSAYALTLTIMFAAGMILMAAVNGESWFASMGRDVRDALHESTGYNPGKVFRRVSLASETRVQAEALLSNRQLQVYFLLAIATAGLAYIFVKREMPAPTRRQHAMLVSVLIAMLLPVSLATVTYGEVFAALVTKTICIVILILLGCFAVYELLRAKPPSLAGKAFQALVLVLVLLEGVVLPGLYGWYFFWRNA